jgi:hypothetical protein
VSRRAKLPIAVVPRHILVPTQAIIARRWSQFFSISSSRVGTNAADAWYSMPCSG